MPNRERSSSAVLSVFGLSACLTFGVSACSSGSDGMGGSEPIREQIETDRTHQERMREMEDRNGGGGGY